MTRETLQRGILLLIGLLLMLTFVPAPAAAETRSAGTIVVGPNETVAGDLTAFGGTVVVRGTVDGDLEAFAGNVYVEGAVTGDVNAFAGTVRIDGTVEGRVTAMGGTVRVEPDATIGRSLRVAGGTVVVAGTVAGDAEIGAGSLTLTSTASVGGDVRFDTAQNQFVNEGAAVGGTITRTDEIEFGSPWRLAPPGWVFDVYGLFVTLLVGTVLLLVLPDVSTEIARTVARDPVRTGAVGLLVLLGIPVALVLIASTIIGIPLSLVGILVYGLVVWIGAVYGRYAVGDWLVSYGDVENRWLALSVGVTAVFLAKRVPVLGGLVEFVVVILGLGAMVAIARGAAARRGSTGRQTTLEEASDRS